MDIKCLCNPIGERRRRARLASVAGSNLMIAAASAGGAGGAAGIGSGVTSSAGGICLVSFRLLLSSTGFPPTWACRAVIPGGHRREVAQICGRSESRAVLVMPIKYRRMKFGCSYTSLCALNREGEAVRHVDL